MEKRKMQFSPAYPAAYYDYQVEKRKR